MSIARTARRVRKRMSQNNNHLSGLGVSRRKQPTRAFVTSVGSKKKR